MRTTIVWHFITFAIILGLSLTPGAPARAAGSQDSPACASLPSKACTGLPAGAASPRNEGGGWLSTPASADDLATDRKLLLLAGHLIQARLVNAADCPDHGLVGGGAASPCGQEKAHSAVVAWQNRFDPIIFAVARQTDVPPFLLKGLFAQETQFWPAATRNAAWSFGEYGLGQLNDHGADTLLLWNPDFYHKLCPSVFRPEFCWPGYALLLPGMKATLRGASLAMVTADCPACALGLDLQKAEASIPVFAEAVLANRRQVRQGLHNLTGLPAEVAVSYEDLWRYTLVNYHVGVGCLYAALGSTWQAKEVLDWEHVSRHFEAGCDTVAYVENISRWP